MTSTPDDRGQGADRRPESQAQGPSAEGAGLAAAIERWSADLALGEEPSRFLRALDDGAAP